jgi:hypothetical protein
LKKESLSPTNLQRKPPPNKKPTKRTKTEKTKNAKGSKRKRRGGGGTKTWVPSSDQGFPVL